MACGMCEHCHAPVDQNETFTVREGFSYHEKCHKCYVCSETDLADAEVFKGVIFCRSCSQRIFQGCSTARQRKTSSRLNREKSQKRRSHRTNERTSARDGILQLTTLAVSDTSSSENKSKLSNIKSNIPSDITALEKDVISKNVISMKRSSVEMGMTTEVTQELLKQMNCPVITDSRKPTCSDKPKTKIKERKKKPVCSDLRIAELGASTEIANMALRNKYEMPVIIKSDLGPMESRSMSGTNQESDTSQHEEWTDSAYCSLRDSTRTYWMDRRLGSILKLPYKAFKTNILNRSSLVSHLMISQDHFSLMNRIKCLFNEEITDHQRRGLQRLYSTINRKNTPKKLGWLDTVANVCADQQIEISNQDCCHHKRCKHFRTSHSYRCMRAQVMKLAGPTVSELTGFRNKVKNLVAPGFLRSGTRDDNYPAILMTQACGISVQGSTEV